MKCLKLLFIRHAQSVGNVQKRLQGRGEFELTKDGRLQAEKLAHRLANDQWRPTHVYSSPLKRTAQTAEILLSKFVSEPIPASIRDLAVGDEDETLEPPAPSNTIPLEYRDELLEIQNGVFEGLTWAEAKAAYPELCHRLESSPDWIPVPGAETLDEIRDRAHRFTQSLLQRHRDGDQVWIVTHSGVLQHLIATLMGSDRSWRLPIHNTALFEFWVNQKRWQRSDPNARHNTDLWQVRRFNDYRHLDRRY
jgi:2,3-bisphosphoglycerate-dependent phosphoglycerate mutase